MNNYLLRHKEVRARLTERGPGLMHREISEPLAVPGGVALFQLHIAGFGALNGHIGFDQVGVTDDKAFKSHAYAHYLHHRHFEVNYGGDQLVPLDMLFGTWHDGSPEGEARMQARFAKKRAKLNAG